MIKITNKIGFEDRCWVGLIDSSTFNRSEEDRIKAVTDMASITKGKLEFDKKVVNKGKGIAQAHWDSRIKLYKRLLKESAGNPSTPFEFIPLSEKFSFMFRNKTEDSFLINTLKYSTLKDDVVYTNYRSGLYNNRVFPNTKNEVEDFKVIVGRVPFKVIEYLNGKSAFSLIYELQNESEEVYKKYLDDIEFWYPSWWNELQVLASSRRDESRIQDVLGDISSKMTTPEEATMELSDRRLVTFAMAAWKQDTNAWNNLFAVRGEGTGTQNITGMTIENIKKLI